MEPDFIAEKPWQKEVKERPEFAQMVFHRRAGEAKVMARLQLTGNLRVSGLRVLDELLLVEDDAVKLVLEQHRLIARQQRVGSDDQIVLRNALELSFAIEAVEHEHTQRRGKALGLL